MRLRDVPTDPIELYMSKIRGDESSGNDRAAATGSSAKGRYQFTNSTWKNAEKELGKKLDVYNGQDQDVVMRWLTTQNSNYLKNKGIENNPTNLYMVHFLGQAGANRFFSALNANPNASASSFATEAEYSANKSLFNKGKTVAGLYNIMSKKVGGSQMAVSNKAQPVTNAVDITRTSSPQNMGEIPQVQVDNPLTPLIPIPEFQQFRSDFSNFMQQQQEQQQRMEIQVKEDAAKSALDERIRERDFLASLISSSSLPFVERKTTE